MGGTCVERIAEQYKVWLDAHRQHLWLNLLCRPCIPKDGSPPPQGGDDPLFYQREFCVRVADAARGALDGAAAPKLALFTGCGLGGFVPVLRDRLPRLGRLLAVDLVPEMLEAARGAFAGSADFVCADIAGLVEGGHVAPGSAELVVDEALLSHLYRPGKLERFQQCLQALAAAMAPGGVLVASGGVCTQGGEASADSLPDHFAAAGLDLVSVEDLTADCAAACPPALEAMQKALGEGSAVLEAVRSEGRRYQREAAEGTRRAGIWMCRRRRGAVDPGPIADYYSKALCGADPATAAPWLTFLCDALLPAGAQPAPPGESPMWYYQSVYDRLAGLAAPHLPAPFTGRVLEVGCGRGGGAARLRTELLPAAAEVVGIDLVPGLIAFARAAFAGIGGLRFAVGDATALQPAVGPASCDLAVVIGVLFAHLTPAQVSAAVAQLALVVRPGGLLLHCDRCGAAGDKDYLDLLRCGGAFEEVAVEDVTEDTCAAHGLVAQHMFGGEGRAPAVPREEQERSAGVVDAVRDYHARAHRRHAGEGRRRVMAVLRRTAAPP
eukprot:TRINITY_DN5045_c0_g1_i1.p1 TRINITY_DN5045_c0_g1~~TRINITY_DN5045_c0_g1_i1.p1  ORF type:complete len:578 (+),score=142.34 TRINITY_DN5045_c0_g1_i1:80-1735(+)